ncbi:hypothetical protein BH10PSE11_BH10PSE11_38420 [soil metagenome]
MTSPLPVYGERSDHAVIRVKGEQRVLMAAPHPSPLPQERGEGAKDYVLNRKCITSPSATTYSLPSSRSFPVSRAPDSPPLAI